MKMTEKRLWQAWELLRGGAYTRRELAKSLGVSQMTAGRLADRLLGIGILSERRQTGERGRPTGILFADPRWQYWILKMNGARREAVLVSGSGEVLYRMDEPCEEGMEPWDGLSDFLGRLRTTRRLLRRLEEPRAIALVLMGSAVGMPLPQGEINLVIEGEDRGNEEICGELTRRILLGLEKTGW